MKILLVEDFEGVRNVVKNSLTFSGYDVATCGDAESALALLQNDNFSLIILDLNLPGMDGFEFCRRIKADKSHGDTYILVMTGRAELADINEAIDAGADDYMIKPFDFDSMTLHLTIAKQKMRLFAERKKMQESLNESNDRFNQLTNAIHEVFWLHDVIQNKVIYVSPAYESIMGRKIETCYSDPWDWTNAIHPEDRPKVIEEYKKTLAGANFEQEFRIIIPDGTIRWIYDRGYPIIDADKRCCRIAGIAEDITKFREIVNQLKDAKNAAKSADRAKSQFFAGMSHELRTPLNGIIGYGEILQNQLSEAGNAKQQKYIDNIVTSGHRLLNLINDLLDLVALDADQVSCQFSHFDVARLLATKVKSQLESMAVAKKIHTTVTADADVGEFFCDEAKLEQILYHLISNAVKFTPPEGTIKIHAKMIKNILQYPQSNDRIPVPILEAIQSISAAKNSQSAILISVSDTGAGVAAERQEQIFSGFVFTESSYARKHFSAGIGLPITKRLVEMHGGRLWVESAGEGQGSVFRFLIPNHRASKLKSGIFPIQRHKEVNSNDELIGDDGE